MTLKLIPRKRKPVRFKQIMCDKCRMIIKGGRSKLNNTSRNTTLIDILLQVLVYTMDAITSFHFMVQDDADASIQRTRHWGYR
jgi:hypothetical protein